jgi:signal transduction histidine kinase
MVVDLPPTFRQTSSALAVPAILLAGFGAVVPFAGVPLARIDAFIPTLEAIIFAADLITSVLLFSQFSIYPSPALLALASGYLFSALMVVPHVLTFPGAFSPTGLLGAGIQSAAWLYWLWHLGFAMALLVYGWLRDEKHEDVTKASTTFAIGWSVALVFVLVCGLTWLATAGDEILPRLFRDQTHLTPISHYLGGLTALTCASAITVLWIRRRSVLDQWLMIVVLATALDGLSALLVTARFSLAFYTTRAFMLITSAVVLVVLLAETMRLYARLARSNTMLQRERNNKLMNMEAMAASIAHELKQPLTGIVSLGSATLRFLGQTPPNVARAESGVKKIIIAGQETNKILDNMRALFGRAKIAKDRIDVNELVLDALRALDSDFKSHRIATNVNLTPELPPIMAHKVQLQEVIINLIHNAIEAMDLVDDDHRMLKFETQLSADDAITITVEDTGPGFDSEKSNAIFDAFVTTKPHGMGLGLAICQRIVEQHGGQLSASSANPQGAIFQIILPRTNLTS